MSSMKKGESASTASGVDERTETYKSATTEATSTTRFGDDVYSYTRVSKISKGFFDNDDLALRHYDEAKDTFTALEAAYKRLLLQVEASKQERRYEVNFIYTITQNILKMPFRGRLCLFTNLDETVIFILLKIPQSLLLCYDNSRSSAILQYFSQIHDWFY